MQLGFRIYFGPQHREGGMRPCAQANAERIVREAGRRLTTRPIPHLWAVCPCTETGLPNLYENILHTPIEFPRRSSIVRIIIKLRK